MLKNSLRELEEDNMILANNCQEMRLQINILSSNIDIKEKEKERHLEHNALEKQKMKTHLEGLITSKDEERRKIGYLSDENIKLKNQLEALKEKYETDKSDLLKVIILLFRLFKP